MLELYSQEITRLRLLSFPVFQSYNLFPKYVLRTYHGRVVYGLLRHSMFNRQQRQDGYLESDDKETHAFLSDTTDPQERWWMLVPLRPYRTLWEYIAEFLVACY